MTQSKGFWESGVRSSSEQVIQLNIETIYLDKDTILPVLPWKSYLFSYNSRIKFHGNMNHDLMNQWCFKALIYELFWQFEEQSLGCLVNSALLKESQDVSKLGRGDFLSFYVDANMTSTTFTRKWKFNNWSRISANLCNLKIYKKSNWFKWHKMKTKLSNMDLCFFTYRSCEASILIQLKRPMMIFFGFQIIKWWYCFKDFFYILPLLSIFLLSSAINIRW